MKVLGLSNELTREAEQECAEGFRAWMAEAQNGTWGNWDELLRHYPLASRTSGDEAHFPLTDDGTGVRAQVYFHTRLMILRCIAPAPISARVAARRQTSPLSTRTHTQATSPTNP